MKNSQERNFISFSIDFIYYRQRIITIETVSSSVGFLSAVVILYYKLCARIKVGITYVNNTFSSRKLGITFGRNDIIMLIFLATIEW